MKKLALIVLVAAGCAAPPPASEEASTSPSRVLAASAALGDSAGATWREAGGRTGTERRSTLLAARVAEARALADSGEHSRASEVYETVYKGAPRSKLAEDALFLAADEAFRAEEHARSFDLLEKLLTVYPATTHYAEVVDRVFQIGKAFAEGTAKRPSWVLGIKKTDEKFGIDILEYFERQHHTSDVNQQVHLPTQSWDRHPLAPQALYIIGETHVREDEPELAIESWERIVKEYPGTSWARVAEYRIALAFISLSYGPDYDKRPLLTGVKRLRNYLKKNPTGDNFQEASQKLKELEESLARHDLAIAKRYASSDRYRAAHIYLDAIRREYPNTDAAKEAEQLSGAWENPPDPPAPDETK